MQKEVKWLMDYLDARPILPDMQKAMDLACKWSRADHGYESKNARIKEYNQNNQGSGFDYYDIMCHIFAGTILHPEGMTYQAMIGYISGTIGCADPLDRAKCAAELIAIAYQAELVVITKVSDKTFMITTEYIIHEEIPQFTQHAPEFKKPDPVLFNQILGNQFKQHDGDACIDHINKMNAIPLCLEMRILDELEETTKAGLETQEQLDQWEVFKVQSDLMYAEVNRRGNEFYLKHNMDTRGRCYCEGYLINYQGSAYKKAIVQLANKEIIEL